MVASPAAVEAERLSLTVFFAIVAHAIVILGVSFTFEDPIESRFDTMEIILVQKSSAEAPDDARYLAQASQQGGGESDEPDRPSAPLAAPLPDTRPAVVTQPAASEPAPPAAGNQRPEQLAVDARAQRKVHSLDRPLDAEEEAPRLHEAPHWEQKKKFDPLAFLDQDIAIASLDAEIKQALRTYAERPRHKYISANTRAYRYAAYMEAWRAKVERIGNLNYPDKARRQRLSGSLVLDVSLNPDGSVNEIVVRRPSGHKILDDAAMRIVRLGSPFAPFPDNIREETDILHITRTWQFLSSGSLRSR